MSTTSKIKILSRPRLTAAHNKRSIIKIGSEVPITKIQQSTDGNNSSGLSTAYGYVSQYTEFKDIGITLEVTPLSIVKRFISMNLHLTVSSIDKSKQYTSILGNPTIKKRETQTYGTVKSSNTIVIGGLIKQSENTTNKKVPFLGDIPVIGNLFKKTIKTKKKTELLIFITPTLSNTFDFLNTTN